MGIAAVARKDFADAVRSYSLGLATALFVLFAAGLATIQWVPDLYREGQAQRTTLALLNSMRQPTVFFVPMLALMIAYDSIAGERESGSLRLLLSLPHSRTDVVVGKLLGRTAVVTVAILVGYAVAGLIALTTYDSFDTGVFASYTLLTVFYAAVYIALATGFSAGMRSRLRAFVAAGGLYVLFLVGWDLLLLVLQLLIYGRDIPEAGLPDWFNFLGLLNPSTAFMHAARAVIPEYAQITFYPEGSAVYLQNWVGFVILGLWGAVPLLFGYVRFRRMEV